MCQCVLFEWAPVCMVLVWCVTMRCCLSEHLYVRCCIGVKVCCLSEDPCVRFCIGVSMCVV